MHRKKTAALNSSSVSQDSATITHSNTCLCGRKFSGKGWYARHVLSCNQYLSQMSSTTDTIPSYTASEMCDNLNELEYNSAVSLILDDLIELEGLEESGDYDDDDSNMHNVKLNELNSDQEEISFDSKEKKYYIDDEFLVWRIVRYFYIFNI